jgi:hypothetical protein
MDQHERNARAQKQAEYEALYSDFDFMISEHTQLCSDQESDAKDPATTPTPSETEPEAAKVAIPPPTDPEEDPDDDSSDPDDDSSDASSDFNIALDDVPADAEHKESLTDESSESDDSDTDDDSVTWMDLEDEMSPEDLLEDVNVVERFVFLNCQVGDENLTLRERLGNWVISNLPFTRADTSTLVNAASAELFSESLSLHHTTQTEVKGWWSQHDTAGWKIAQARGTIALFRTLLPACVKVDIYSDIARLASVDPKLNKQQVITKDLKISRALGPIVTDFVYSQAAQMTGHDDPSILTWTTIAIMNQLTAMKLVTHMGGNGGEMGFRTWGRSRTAR